MIKVFLRGGLGNQMFQYALGLNLARKNNTELTLDTTALNDRFPRRNFTYRNFDLDVFKLQPRFTALSKISEKLPIPGAWLGLDLGIIKIQNILNFQKMIIEKNERVFDASVFSLEEENILLLGYWQNEKYFKDVESEVRTSFTFRYPLVGEAGFLAKKVKSSHSVSLHVRRGDYVSFKNVEQSMGKTDLSYYDRAARYINEHVPLAEFYIFSDDIAWCRENLKLPFPVTYVSPSSAGLKAIYHLELMSLCKHNIIANSTFSWWGAWLNQNPGKIIVAPKRWYAGDNNKENQADIVPIGWIKE